MDIRLLRRVALCVLSGIAVALIEDADVSERREWLQYILSGIAFAAGVLTPYLKLDRWVALRAFGLAAASTLSYYVAVWLALDGPFADSNDWISFTLASVAGAALVIVPAVYIAPIRASGALLVLGLISGLIGGPVTRSTLPEELPLILIGHMTWHSLMGIALYYGTVGSKRPFRAAARRL